MFRKFLQNCRGNVLPTFAIAAIPLIVSTGGVIDYSRAYDQRTVVQDAMDAAALAAGKKIGLISDPAVKVEANTFFVTNVGSKVTLMPLLVSAIAGSTITLTTTLKVPTYFLGLIGLTEFNFPLIAKATLAMGTLEIAMALDNSGSMAGTKISTLITAATDLTNTLYGLGATSTSPDPIKVSLVPFASSVKIDPANKTAVWMDTTGVAPYNAESFEGATGSPPVSNNTPSGLNVLNMFDTLSGTGSAWAGCMEERKDPYDVSDDAADTATPASMYVPMFAPDEPDNWTCTTGTCSYSGTTNATRRYNGAPTGTKSHNNYLADNGGTCGDTFTVTIAHPAVFTRTGHGLVAGNELAFTTTGSLPTGLSAGTNYTVIATGLTANAFELEKTSTVTATIATPGVFTSSSHGLVAGDQVSFTTTGSLPTGVTAGTQYYVLAAGLTSNAFEVSATNGAAVTITNASPAVFTRSGHGLVAGNMIVLQTTGSLPTGLTAATPYYVLAAGFSANSFEVAATNSAPAVTITNANPAVFTSSSHGLTAGTAIAFQTGGTLPTGLTAGTTYYVSAAGLSTNNFKVQPTSASTTVTMTKASPAVFTSASHGLTVNTAVAFSTTGALYTGLTAGTTYYVKTVPTASTFTVSATVGGTAINTSGSQSGTHSWVRLVATTSAGSGTHSFVKPVVTTSAGSGTHTFFKPVVTSGSQSGTHTLVRALSTSGSQSGTHSYTKTADWTCQSGSADCGGANIGKSEQTALLGQNVASKNICKYGTVANKAAISAISVDTGGGGTYPGGPNFNCTTQAVTPLTPTKATVTTAIGSMVANGTTNITAGLMWGWRVLSPTAPFTDGRAYGGDNQKILILMTDGENTYFANGKFTVSHYGAWGYIWKSHLGTTSSTQSVMTGKMEERMELACANIKAAKVKVYTVAFEITDATTLGLLSTCASDPTMAFQADDPAALTAAFSAIGEQITLLRISQ